MVTPQPEAGNGCERLWGTGTGHGSMWKSAQRTWSRRKGASIAAIRRSGVSRASPKQGAMGCDATPRASPVKPTTAAEITVSVVTLT